MMFAYKQFAHRLPLFALTLLIGAVALTGFNWSRASAAAAQQDVTPTALRPNGKIAFVFQNLYTVNLGGSGQTTLINSDDSIRYPAWSPDGSKIAFSRNVFPVQNLDIFVANADGSNVVRLTNAGNAPTGANTNYGVAWSPDGSKIAFASSRDGGRGSDIWVMNADGSNTVNLTPNTPTIFDLDPSWSPDGTRIAFTSQRAYPGAAGDGSLAFEIYTMNTDGSNIARLTNNQVPDSEPAWSPDGAKIVFSRRDLNGQTQNSDIYLMNADGTGQRNLTNNASADFNPAWSPDGTRIAFVTYRDAGQSNNSEIYIMDADGQFPTRVTNSPGFEEREPDWGALYTGAPTPTPTATPTPFPPTPTPTPYSITGRVRDSNGNGVSGVNVILFTGQNGTRTVLTKADGSYQHYYYPDTRITLSPAKDGYSFSPSNLSYVSSGSITGDKPDTNFTATPFAVPSTLSFSAPTYSVSESTANVTITVTRSGTGALTSGALINYRTVDDPAAVRCDTVGQMAYARCDYATSVDTLYFAAGDTEKTFTIPIINDAHVENTETFTLQLFNSIGSTLGAKGAATVQITDNDASGATNPITDSRVFVRQQYLDFLSREPESAGFQAWLNVLNNCSDVNNNPDCDRLTVSSAFFRSTEFQLKGYFVYRFYTLAIGRVPHYDEIVPDMRTLSGSTAAEVFARRAAYADAWAERPAFKALYDTKTNTEYVNILMDKRGLSQITTPDPAFPDGATKLTFTRSDLIARLNSQTLTRAQVLRAIIESDEVFNAEYNPAFVAMQYFGYLRRDPDPDYNNWLRYLDDHPGDFRTMVNGFMNSYEYRLRFGQP